MTVLKFSCNTGSHFRGTYNISSQNVKKYHVIEIYTMNILENSLTEEQKQAYT